ncbi:MAG: trimethylamine methyltransferase family protein [Anaerolineales bacterium]
MKPTLRLLTDQETRRIVQEAVGLLEDPGIVVNHQGALELLADAGCRVDWDINTVNLSPQIVEAALDSSPARFSLFNLHGQEMVSYGSGQTFYNPGSSALLILDPRTHKLRAAHTEDLAAFIQLVEVLDALDSQSTAMVCSDVPESIQDLYRLYIALNYLTKPIVTGVFQHSSWTAMFEMLVAVVGSSQRLAEKPLAIFDICPTSPLTWSHTCAQNLLDNARAGIPIQIVSMPMAGATAPVTLAGSLVQGSAENLSGVVIAQLASPGAPVVWGGSPAVFDMKYGTPPMGAPGTWLLACAYAQISEAVGLPSQAYLGITDAKTLDFQAGLESAPGALLGALAGLDMVSGAGMLAYENCQSLEKLLLDAEIIALARHFLKGISIPGSPLGLDAIREAGHQGDFISLEHTFQHFKSESHYPSALIDRQRPDDWEAAGSQDAWQRAGEEFPRLLADYPGPILDSGILGELRKIASLAASQAGMDSLPDLPA